MISRRRNLRRLGVVHLMLALASLVRCASKEPNAPPEPERRFVGLELESSTELAPGQRVQVLAFARYTTGPRELVTARCTWETSDQQVATVSSTGVVAAYSVGEATVTARYLDHQTAAVRAFRVQELAPDPDWTFLGPVRAEAVFDAAVHGVMVDPRNANVVYLAADLGWFRSHDAGRSWTALQLFSVRPGALPNPGRLALDPARPGRVFAAFGRTLFTSDEDEPTARVVRSFDRNIVSVLVSTIDSRTLYVATAGAPGEDGLFHRSTDGGTTWHTFAFGHPAYPGMLWIPWTIAEDPVDGLLYVAVELGDGSGPRGRVYRSLDRGVTWQNVTPPNVVQGVRILVDPPTHEVMLLSEGGGIYTSNDHGVTWHRHAPGYVALDLLRDPVDATLFYGGDVAAGARIGGVYVSHDGARTFQHLGLRGRTVGHLAISADGRTLYASAYNSGLYVRGVP